MYQILLWFILNHVWLGNNLSSVLFPLISNYQVPCPQPPTCNFLYISHYLSLSPLHPPISWTTELQTPPSAILYFPLLPFLKIPIDLSLMHNQKLPPPLLFLFNFTLILFEFISLILISYRNTNNLFEPKTL